MRATVPRRLRPGRWETVTAAAWPTRTAVHAGLRDVDVGPKGSGLRDAIQQRRAGAHERADVDIAQRDHAVERRLDQAIALDLLQPGRFALAAARLLRCARIAFSSACTLASCAASCAWD